MSDHGWKSSYPPDGGDRFAKIKLIFARIFGDGENPLAWGFTLFSIQGIAVRIHLLFIVYLLAELIFTLPGNQVGFVFVWPRLLAMIILVFLHEIGHCIACRKLGGEVNQIMLWPLGGLAPCVVPDDWKSELQVALAGPMINLLLVPIFAIPLYLLTGTASSLAFNPLTLGTGIGAITLASGESTWWIVTLHAFHSVNLVLLVFNLLIPMFPLDAATILRSFFKRTKGDLKSMHLMVNIGLGVATAVGLVGILFSDAKMLLAIAIFGGIVCSREKRRLQFLDHADMNPGFSGLSGDRESWKQSPIVDEEDEEIIPQEELDRVLAKISESGIESLSRKERRTLKRATESSRKSQ